MKNKRTPSPFILCFVCGFSVARLGSFYKVRKSDLIKYVRECDLAWIEV